VAKKFSNLGGQGYAGYDRCNCKQQCKQINASVERQVNYVFLNAMIA